MALFKGTVTITFGVAVNARDEATARTLAEESVFARCTGYDPITDTQNPRPTGRYDKVVDIKMIEV